MILVDRTRHLAGLQFCPRARYWEYEYEGVGVRGKALSIPPATGKAFHRAIEPLLKHVKATGKLPSRLAAREMIGAAVEEYQEEAEAAGLRNGQTADSEHVSEEAAWLITEQSTLVEGLAWAFWRSLLPFLSREFEIVAIEQEVNYVLGCDCGLGDGTVGEVAWEDVEGGADLQHEHRQCSGVALMIRPDLITRQLSSGAVAVWDFKTSASDWQPKEMDHLVQLAIGVTGAGEVVGEPCTQHYLVGLHKGQRKSDDKEGKGMKRQRSPFCQVYYKPADPPYGEAEYQAAYTRRKGWGRVPVWEIEFPEQDKEEAGSSAVEHWVLDLMGAEEVALRCSLNGPTQAPVHLIPRILKEVEAETRYWKDVMAAVVEDPGGLDTYVRRSWDCHPYGEPCSFMRICAGDPGLEKPELSGKFVWREPHHALEVEVQK